MGLEKCVVAVAVTIVAATVMAAIVAEAVEALAMVVAMGRVLARLPRPDDGAGGFGSNPPLCQTVGQLKPGPGGDLCPLGGKGVALSPIGLCVVGRPRRPRRRRGERGLQRLQPRRPRDDPVASRSVWARPQRSKNATVLAYLAS